MTLIERRILRGLTLGAVLVGSGCGSDPTPSDETVGSSSTGPTETCVPGEVRACPCPAGAAGMHTCNPAGTGFGACDCPGGTTSTTTLDGTTTTEATTTAADETATATTSMTDSTGASASGSSTGETIDGYGPCFGGDADCMVPGEVCVGAVAGPPLTVCSLQACTTAEDCPATFGGAAAMPACSDLTGDGVTDCYLSCGGDDDCPMGMVCFLEIGPACIWPM